jgi:hypothetical protein
MKALVSSLMVGLISLMLASPGGSQEAGQTASPSRGLSKEACAALEAYFAKVNAARSLTDKVQRQEKYHEARVDLERALPKHTSSDLITQAALYASYSEQVVTSDAADPNLPELLDKRLKVRMTLLESCPGYASTR